MSGALQGPQSERAPGRTSGPLRPNGYYGVGEWGPGASAQAEDMATRSPTLALLLSRQANAVLARCSTSARSPGLRRA